MKLTIDFESRSLVDLTATTTHKYAQDPSTEILCLAVKGPTFTSWWAPEWVAERVLSACDKTLAGLYVDAQSVWGMVDKSDTIEAHNAQFERTLWNEIMVKRYGAPAIPLEKWRCSAAKAAMHALPRSLDNATKALNLPVLKDKAGHALMLKMCKPLPPTMAMYAEVAKQYGISLEGLTTTHASKAMKDRDYSGPHDRELVRWHDTPEALERLLRYCIQDVEAEHGLSSRLKDLPDDELKVWQLDQTINDRGLPVDVEACKAMIEFTQQATTKLEREFKVATGYAVDTPKCYKAFAEWINSRGVSCPGVSKDAINQMLDRNDLPSDVRTALEIAQKANKSSVAKYDALLRGVSADGRLRGQLVYHRATTGRWGGALFQPQNLPRGDFSDVDECITAISSRDFSLAEMLWGDPMHVASTCIRGMVCAEEGKRILDSDFSAIEGRVVAWLAGEETILENYRQGKDAYCAVASLCFGVPYEDILRGYKAGDAEMTKLRGKGKVGDLAGGFGGGQGAVARFAPDMLYAERVDLITQWRLAHPMTKKFWYDLADAAADAVENPGKIFPVGRIAYMYRREYGFLMCRLPSGRKIYYPFPECTAGWIGPGEEARKALITPGTHFRFSDMTIWATEDGRICIQRDADPNGKGDPEKVRVFEASTIGTSPLWRKNARRVTAWTEDSVSHQWVKRDLSHLILCENAVQAVARDLLVSALFKLEENGYPVFLHVHDEAVVEMPEGIGSIDEFERLMCDTPDWAEGLPMSAGGWEGKRFKK